MHKKYCEICGKRPADVDYIEVVGGEKHLMHLCNICAEQKANGLYLLLTKDVEEESTPICPFCGTTLSEVKSFLKPGCPGCYSIFLGEIKDLLKKLQGTDSFTVEEDLKTSEEKDLIDIKHRLMKELEDAVRVEDFERAAKLRDEIDNINERLKWLGMNPSE